MLALIQIFSLYMVNPATLCRDGQRDKELSFAIVFDLSCSLYHNNFHILYSYLELTLSKKVGKAPEGWKTVFHRESMGCLMNYSVPVPMPKSFYLFWLLTLFRGLGWGALECLPFPLNVLSKLLTVWHHYHECKPLRSHAASPWTPVSVCKEI